MILSCKHLGVNVLDLSVSIKKPTSPPADSRRIKPECLLLICRYPTVHHRTHSAVVSVHCIIFATGHIFSSELLTDLRALLISFILISKLSQSCQSLNMKMFPWVIDISSSRAQTKYIHLFTKRIPLRHSAGTLQVKFISITTLTT